MAAHFVKPDPLPEPATPHGAAAGASLSSASGSQTFETTPESASFKGACGVSTVALRPLDMIRGLEVDILVEDDEKKTRWTSGTIAALKPSTSEILVHVTGQKARWLAVGSNLLAPRGTYNPAP